MKLHPLSPEVVRQIAAGEIIDRPAAIVKELIENALDAGATMIQVELQDGGMGWLRVSDNGSGMRREEVPLALQRHTTSKIQDLADLQRIRTLGFRGEALASICAVAQVELLTRTDDELEGTIARSLPSTWTASSNEVAPQLETQAAVHTIGPPLTLHPAASPRGASITVSALFAQVPVRRKFLKSPLREQELVHETLVRYALCYPEVAFRLVCDRREVLQLPPASQLQRCGMLLGQETVGEMVEISYEGFDLRFQGLISRPTLARAGRGGQFFAINRRPVRGGLLAVALERPYAGRLPPGRNPLALLYLDMDPTLVDVNIHPRKTEVRYLQERAVFWAVQQTVGQALAQFPSGTPLAPGTEPHQGEDSRIWQLFNQDLVEPTLIQEAAAAYSGGNALRAIGQLHQSYLLAQDAHGMVVADQHAAHEQILYENLLRNRQTYALSQAWIWELSQREVEAVLNSLGVLADLGFDIEAFGPASLMVRGIPAAIAGIAMDLAQRDAAATPGGVSLAVAGLPSFLEGLLAELQQRRQEPPEILRSHVAARCACLAAVKAGDPLDLSQVQLLLNDLARIWSPATCPHGRPAIFTISLAELERRFLRR